MFRIIGIDGKEYGPASTDQVRQWIAEGRINAQTIAWREGGANWLPISAFPEFADVVFSQPPPRQSAPFPSQSRTNSMALAGFVLALISTISGFCCCFGVPLNLLALVFSIVGLMQIRDNPSQQGKALAIAGLVISSLGLLSGVVISLIQGSMIGSHHFGHHGFRI